MRIALLALGMLVMVGCCKLPKHATAESHACIMLNKSNGIDLTGLDKDWYVVNGPSTNKEMVMIYRRVGDEMQVCTISLPEAAQ